MSFNDRCGDAAEVMAHGGVLGEAAREALVELLRESKETCFAPRDLVMGILDDPANRALRSRTSDGEWREDLGGDSAPCLRILCPDALNGRPHWHTRPADAASPAADEPMSTPDSGGLREALGLAEHEVARRALWRDLAEKNIKMGTDWPFIARVLFHDIDRLLAAHPEPVPTPDSADDATVGEREGCGAVSPDEDWVPGVWEAHDHLCVTHARDEHECACGARWDATPDADDTTPPATGDVEALAIALCEGQHAHIRRNWTASELHPDHCPSCATGAGAVLASDWLKADRATRDAASKAEVVSGIRAWCAINEIAAPPLDWAGLGEYLARIEARP